MITRCKLEQKKNLRQPQDTPKTLKSDCFSTSVKVSGSIGRSKSHAPRHVHTYVKISGQAARNVNFASLRGAGRQLIVMLAQKKICFECFAAGTRRPRAKGQMSSFLLKGGRFKRKASELQEQIGLVPSGKLSSIVGAVLNCRSEIGGTSRQVLDKSLNDELEPLLEHMPLKLAKGGEYVWTLLEPNRLLAHVLASCPELAACYRRAANEHTPTPEDPWDLLICFDEFVPGDKLKPHNSRKAMVLGFNFRQLGPEVSTQMYPIIFCKTFLLNVFLTFLLLAFFC